MVIKYSSYCDGVPSRRDKYDFDTLGKIGENSVFVYLYTFLQKHNLLFLRPHILPVF